MASTASKNGLYYVSVNVQGNADAIRRCLWVLEEYPVDEFLVLPGHHLYKMDYQRLIQAHGDSNAHITIVALNGRRDQDLSFGHLTVNSGNQVTGFSFESARDPVKLILNFLLKQFGYGEWCFDSQILWFQIQVTESDMKSEQIVTSMGIYLINREIMSMLVNEYFPEANDIGSELIPGALTIGLKVRI